MSLHQNKYPLSLFHQAAGDIRQDILQLHQSLKRMHTDIVGKIAALDAQGGIKARIDRHELTQRASELEQALQSIVDVVMLSSA